MKAKVCKAKEREPERRERRRGTGKEKGEKKGEDKARTGKVRKRANKAL